MQRLICQGRFPFWAARDGCLQGFSAVGLLMEAVRQIWVVSEQCHYGDTEQTSWCDEDYFKADHRDGLAAQFLFCSLWCAPPTCFLCSLHNSGLNIQTFHTYSRLIQPIFLLLNMVKIPLIISFLKWFHYAEPLQLAFAVPSSTKSMFLGYLKKKSVLIKRKFFYILFIFKF